MDGSTMTEFNETPETARQKAVFERAMKSIELSKAMRSGEGHAIMLMFEEFAEATQEGSLLARAVHFSKLFLITFTCIAPVYLFWSVAFSG